MISTEDLGARIAIWRKRRERTQADLAKRVGIARTTLVAIEKGQRRPLDRELPGIAKELDVRVHDLVKDNAVAGGVAPRFRLPPRAGVNRKVLEKAVEATRTLGALYVELERLLGLERVPAPLESITTYRVPGPGRWGDPARAGEHAAHTVRSTMDLGDAPVFELETLLEMHAGLRIFHLGLDPEILALFFWGADLGGCVSVNPDHPHERRRWGLAHQFAHFLRDRERGEVLLVGSRHRHDEAWVFADRFAAEFLLPSTGVRKYFSGVSRGSRFTVADVVQMARFFGVSFDAMLRRLVELELVPRGARAAIATSDSRVHEGEVQFGPGRGLAKPELLPERYQLLALTAFHRELISETELADYLQCDRIEARAIHDAKRRAFSDQGLLELDLARDLLGSRED